MSKFTWQLWKYSMITNCLAMKVVVSLTMKWNRHWLCHFPTVFTNNLLIYWISGYLNLFTLFFYLYLLETRYKLASGNEGDKQQLQWLYSACKGIIQVHVQGSIGLVDSIYYLAEITNRDYNNDFLPYVKSLTLSSEDFAF